jgi:hypothetical protein
MNRNPGRKQSPSRRRLAALCLLAALALSACSSTGTAVDSAISTATTAGVAAGVARTTGSALVGTAAGIGLDAGVKYAERRIHRNAQDAVADAAGPLLVGQSARWNIDASLPLFDRHGVVEVARSFGSAIPCKDVVFTVDDDDNLYVTTVCADKRGVWRWALAEPTVDRWGSLQ